MRQIGVSTATWQAPSSGTWMDTASSGKSRRHGRCAPVVSNGRGEIDSSSASASASCPETWRGPKQRIGRKALGSPPEGRSDRVFRGSELDGPQPGVGRSKPSENDHVQREDQRSSRSSEQRRRSDWPVSLPGPRTVSETASHERSCSRPDPQVAHGDHFRTLFTAPGPPCPGPSDSDPHLERGDQGGRGEPG